MRHPAKVSRRRSAKLISRMAKTTAAILLLEFVAALAWSVRLEFWADDRGLSQWRTILHWSENLTPTPENLPEFAKTAELMAYSQVSQGLLNLFYSPQTPTNKNDLLAVSGRMIRQIDQPGLRFGGMPEAGLPPHGFSLYFAHSLLVKCTDRILIGAHDSDPQIEKVLAYLVQESGNRHGIAAPYASENAATFPADQSALLLAVHLCRQTLNIKSVDSLMDAFLAGQKDSLVFIKLGLHPSGWNYRHADIPRGVGLAYEISNLARIRPQVARELFMQYKENFLTCFGPWCGFREWPRGERRQADLDSGPVLFNVGVAATALSIPATKLFDVPVAARILRLGRSVGFAYRHRGEEHFALLDLIDKISHLAFETRRPDLILVEKALQDFARASLFAGETTWPWPLKTN